MHVPNRTMGIAHGSPVFDTPAISPALLKRLNVRTGGGFQDVYMFGVPAGPTRPGRVGSALGSGYFLFPQAAGWEDSRIGPIGFSLLW